MRSRPNFLLITSDQHRGDCFGFEGRKVKTPHLDQMARLGTRFSACITPNLVCQPARASILTGLLPLTHGVRDNGINLDPAVGEAGFAGTLTNAGYATGLIGKAHLSSKHTYRPTGTPECRFSSSDYGPDWFGPYMGFQHVDLALGSMSRSHLPLRPPHGQHFERWFAARGYDEVVSLYLQELPPNNIGAAQTWNSALPVAWHPTTYIADRAIAFLAKQTGTTPFCLWASFPDPHHPFDAPEPWSRLYNPDEIDIPKHRTKDLERRPWFHKASLEGIPQMPDAELTQFRTQGSRVPDQTDQQLRHMTANYYSMISLLDHSVGRILTALEDRGFADDTIVVFTTDHGDLMGDHGLYLKGPTPYEGLLRVGMIVKGPCVPAGKVVDDPVSTLDLAASFYDWAALLPRNEPQGRSLKPLIETNGASRDVAYSEWYPDERRNGIALQLRTVRTKTHKCTFDLNSGAGELYNLINDPHEMDNLFDDPGYAKIRGELKDLMRARPGTIRDTFPEPVGMS